MFQIKFSLNSVIFFFIIIIFTDNISTWKVRMSGLWIPKVLKKYLFSSYNIELNFRIYYFIPL